MYTIYQKHFFITNGSVVEEFLKYNKQVMFNRLSFKIAKNLTNKKIVLKDLGNNECQSCQALQNIQYYSKV